MKPTAKAAKTVASTDSWRRSQVVALHVVLETRAVGAGEGRAAAPSGAAAPAPPAHHGEARSRRRRAGCRAPGTTYTSTSPKLSSPWSPGRASTLSPNSATSACFTSSFDLQLGDQPLDVGALALGLRGLAGKAERRAAHRAHHLVLDVAEAWSCGQSWAAAAAGSGERASSREQRDSPSQQRLHFGPHESLVHRPAPHRGDLAVWVDHEGLRILHHAEGLDPVPVLVLSIG